MNEEAREDWLYVSQAADLIGVKDLMTPPRQAKIPKPSPFEVTWPFSSFDRDQHLRREKSSFALIPDATAPPPPPSESSSGRHIVLIGHLFDVLRVCGARLVTPGDNRIVLRPKQHAI